MKTENRHANHFPREVEVEIKLDSTNSLDTMLDTLRDIIAIDEESQHAA